MIHVKCATSLCGFVIALPEEVYEKAKTAGSAVYCAAGHGTRLIARDLKQEEIDRLKRERADLLDSLREVMDIVEKRRTKHAYTATAAHYVYERARGLLRRHPA